MRAALAASLLLAACHRAAPEPDTPGARLEAAAQAAGLIADTSGSLAGTWSRETDRLCVVPAASGGFAVGVSIDYGPGQQCAGRGTAVRHDDSVRFTFGGCTLDARVDGGALVFPAVAPAGCDALCSGRASLAAMRVERLDRSLSEAATMRAPGGARLCPG